MRLFKAICVGITVSLLFSTLLFAGNIRTVWVDASKMATANLALGRSTVLSFDKEPKKVISGNANYFGVEFTGKDVTIQPLANLVSNLFVYTEDRRYGLILKVGSEARYDDLVYVRWQSPRINFKPKKKINYPSAVWRHKFKVSLTNVSRDHTRGFELVDFVVTNLSQKEISFKKKKFWITRGKKSLPVVSKVWAKDKIKFGESTRIRLILKLKSKRGFTTHFKLLGRRLRIVVQGKYLK